MQLFLCIKFCYQFSLLNKMLSVVCVLIMAYIMHIYSIVPDGDFIDLYIGQAALLF